MKQNAFAELDLLRAVADFKDKFYHRGWARCDLAVPGTMALVPPDHVLKAVERDYQGMRFMIFGDRNENSTTTVDDVALEFKDWLPVRDVSDGVSQTSSERISVHLGVHHPTAAHQWLEEVRKLGVDHISS